MIEGFIFGVIFGIVLTIGAWKTYMTVYEYNKKQNEPPDNTFRILDENEQLIEEFNSRNHFEDQRYKIPTEFINDGKLHRSKYYKQKVMYKKG